MEYVLNTKMQTVTEVNITPVEYTHWVLTNLIKAGRE